MKLGKKGQGRPGRTHIRKSVFLPAFLTLLISAVTGLWDEKLLVRVFRSAFESAYRWLGWLFQLTATGAFVIVLCLLFSKSGRIRIGGEGARPKYGFWTWFAMSLTGGLTSGLVAVGVSQPVAFFENLWGELDGYGIPAAGQEAALFALGRTFHEWTLVPYSFYVVSGVLVAYMCYNRHQPNTVSSSLIPVFGEKLTRSKAASVVDALAVLALALGTVGTLGTFLSLASMCLETVYQVRVSHMMLFAIMVVVTGVYLASSVSGVDRGIKFFAQLNTVFYIGLLAVVCVYGSAPGWIGKALSADLYWLKHFPLWSADTGAVGGEALVKWWTVYSWAFWIAYAPVTGIFLARLSYGRTIREFIAANWLLPSVFVQLWFAVFGNTGIAWQASGRVDLAGVISARGMYSAIWTFLEEIPLAKFLIPVTLFTMLISFSTGADNSVSVISALSIRGGSIGDEAPAAVKTVWGVVIGVLAYLLMAFAAGEKGNDGVRYMVVAVGAILLFLTDLQLAAVVRLFFTRGSPGRE